MQYQDPPSHRPTPTPQLQDQLNSCKVSAICSRSVVSSAHTNTPQDTLQNLLSEESHTTPQKLHTQSAPPPNPQDQLKSCKLLASCPRDKVIIKSSNKINIYNDIYNVSLLQIALTG